MNISDMNNKIDLLLINRENIIINIKNNDINIKKYKDLIKAMKIRSASIFKSIIILALLFLIKCFNPVVTSTEIICYIIIALLSSSNAIYNYVMLKKEIQKEKQSGDYNVLIKNLERYYEKSLESINNIDKEISSLKYNIEHFDEYLIKLENDKKKLEEEKKRLEELREKNNEKRGFVKKIERIKLYRR